MITPEHLEGGAAVKISDGLYYVPDFEHPDFHDGSLVHYSDTLAAATMLGFQVVKAGQAFNTLYRHARHRRFPVEPEAWARRSEWDYRSLNPSDHERSKRLRIFLSAEHTADLFYDSILPATSDWPAQHLDVIDTILQVRGQQRYSQKRVAQLAYRSLTQNI